MISHKNNPWAGTDILASHRLFFANIVVIESGATFPSPTSNKVPTIALTILRKNRSAVISK
jgi:hypothetical protein